MKRLAKVLTVCIIISLLLSLMGASVFAETDQLKIGITVDESTLTPYTYTSGAGLHLVGLVYDSLFQLDENLIPQPWMVKNYSLSDDALTYTFELYDNISWHDGVPFTAEDVKFTYEYIMKYPKKRFSNPSSKITAIEVISDYEFTMTVESPQPTFLVQPLADLPILPKHIWESITDPDTSSETVGTGPYKLTDIQTGEYYKMDANMDYFRGVPVAKEVIIPVIVDMNTLFTALTTGEIDATNRELKPELLSQFEGISNIKLLSGTGYSSTILQFNHEVAPFDQKEFRQAISYAIDVKEIVDIVMLGQATMGSKGFMHPQSPYANTDIEPAKQDVDMANELLDGLGYKDTNDDGIREMDGEALSFELLVYSNNTERIRIAEFVRDWLEDIGITIKIVALDMDTVDELVWPGFDVEMGRTYDMTMWGWSAPTLTFPQRLSTIYESIPNGYLNIGAYSSVEIDALAAKLAAEYDDAARMTIIKDMQAIVAEDMPFIPLYYPNLVYAYNADVYDNWTFMKGMGIVNKLSLIDEYDMADAAVTEEPAEEATAEPTEEPAEEEPAATEKPMEEPAEDASTGNWWVLIIIIAAVIAIIVVLTVINKKKKSK